LATKPAEIDLILLESFVNLHVLRVTTKEHIGAFFGILLLSKMLFSQVVMFEPIPATADNHAVLVRFANLPEGELETDDEIAVFAHSLDTVLCVGASKYSPGGQTQISAWKSDMFSDGLTVGDSLSFQIGDFSENFIYEFPDVTFHTDGQCACAGIFNDEFCTEITLEIAEPPVAFDVQSACDEDNYTLVILRGQDQTTPDSLLNFVIVSEPYSGTINIENIPYVLYYPDANFYGTDYLYFVAIDESGFQSEPATVTIEVNPINDAPFAENDAISIDEEEIAIFSFQYGDIDDAFAELVLEIITNPMHAKNFDILQADGAYYASYEPEDNFYNFGSAPADSVLFSVSDSSGFSDLGKILIQINPVPDSPEIKLINDVSTGEDELAQTSAFATDADYLPDSGYEEQLIFTVGDDVSGVLVDVQTVNLGGIWLGQIALQPENNWHGTTTIPIVVQDSYGETDSVSFDFTVTPANDAPIAESSFVQTNEDSSVPIVFSGDDAEGDALTFSVVGAPIHGEFSNGIYSPNENYFGADSIIFTAYDGELQSEPATVSVEILPINDPPIADAGDNIFTEDTTGTGFVWVTLNGTNSFDIDSENLDFDWRWLEGFSEGMVFSQPFSAGIHEVVLSVTDDFSAVDTDTITVTVVPFFQSLNLENWSWISTNLDLYNSDINYIFSEILDHVIIMISPSGDFFIPNSVNEIGNWDRASGYAIAVDEPVVLEIDGSRANWNTEIALNPGWNFVAYLPDEPMEISYALQSINENLAIAKSRQAFYIPGTSITLGDMSSGEGYKLGMWSADTLVYPTEIIAKTAASQPKTIAEGQHFEFTSGTSDYYPVILESLKIDGLTMNAGDEIAVFSNGRCVGSSVLTDEEPFWIVAWKDDISTKKIDGYRSGKTIGLQFWDQQTKQIIDLRLQFTDGNDQFDGYYSRVTATGIYLPKDFSLSQNRPNPFNPETVISYELPVDSDVQLAVYNLRGQLVKTLVNQTQKVGHYSVALNAENIASGVYFYHIICRSDNGQNFIETKKMILLR